MYVGMVLPDWTSVIQCIRKDHVSLLKGKLKEVNCDRDQVFTGPFHDDRGLFAYDATRLCQMWGVKNGNVDAINELLETSCFVPSSAIFKVFKAYYREKGIDTVDPWRKEGKGKFSRFYVKWYTLPCVCAWLNETVK